MYHKQCCVPGCGSSSMDGVKQHFFPHPLKHKEKFQKWVRAIGGDILESDPRFLYINRRVCNRHFDKRFIYSSNKLSRQAVPELFGPYDSTSEQKDSRERETVPKIFFKNTSKVIVIDATNGKPDFENDPLTNFNEIVPTTQCSDTVMVKDKLSCEPPLKECYVSLTRLRECELPSGYPDRSKQIPKIECSSANPTLKECYVSLTHLKDTDSTKCPVLKDTTNVEIQSNLAQRDTEGANRHKNDQRVLSWNTRLHGYRIPSKYSHLYKYKKRRGHLRVHRYSDHTYCVQQKDGEGDFNVNDDNEDNETLRVLNERTPHKPIGYVNEYLKGEPIDAPLERRLALLRADHTYSKSCITFCVRKADADVVRKHFENTPPAAKKSLVSKEIDSASNVFDENGLSDDGMADNENGIANNEDGIAYDGSGEPFDVEMCENPLDVKACRLCLTLDGELRDLDDGLRKICSDLGVDMIDANMPDSICVMCIAQVTKASVFKSQCARAYDALARAICDREQVWGKDERDGKTWKSAILSVNRDELHLGRVLTTCDIVQVIIHPDPEYAKVLDKSEVEDEVKREKDSEEADEDGNLIPEVTTNDVDENREAEDIDEDESKDKDLIPEVTTNDVDENGEAKDITDVIPEDIDLNDVFKGLEDHAASELESLCDDKNINSTFGFEKKPPRLRLKLNRKWSIDWIHKASEALSSCRIRVLSAPEQIRKFTRRANATAFTEAANKCVLCLEIFVESHHLKNHMFYVHQKWSKENKNGCEICTIDFDSKDDLYAHCMMQHWYEFNCNYCKEPHDTLQSLLECYDKNAPAPQRVNDASVEQSVISFKSHFKIRSQTKEELYNQRVHTQPNSKIFCDVCNRGFIRDDALKVHLSMHEPFEGSTCQCEYCKIYFFTKHGLCAHVRKSHMYSYKCLYCDEVLYSVSVARYHYLSIHKHPLDIINEGSYQCRICNAILSNKSQFWSHKRTHLCHCSVCGEVTSCLQALYKHQLAYHTHIRPGVRELNDPSARCAECDLYFVSNSALKVHLEKHHILQCMRCGAKFRAKRELRAHFYNCDGEKQNVPRNCDVQDAKSGIKEAQKDKSRLYLCNVCGKTMSEGHFRAHLRRHKYEPRCKFCKTRYRGDIALIQHTLSYHTEKPYICNICNSRYRTRALCKAHILKIHAPELLYSCQWCPRRFAYKDFFKKHVRNEHKDKAADFVLDYKQEQGKQLYTYPHMRMDVSLVPAELVTQVTLYMSDYTGTNFTQLSDTDKYKYLYVDHSIDPNVPTICEIISHNMIRKLAQKRGKIRYRNKVKRSKTENGDSNALNRVDGHVGTAVDLEPVTNEPSYKLTNDAFDNVIENSTERTDADGTALECDIANPVIDENDCTDDTEYMEEVVTEENAQVPIESDIEFSGQFIANKAKQSAHETVYYITENEFYNTAAFDEHADDENPKDSLAPVKKYRIDIVRRKEVKELNVDETSEFVDDEYGNVQQQNIVQYIETGEQVILESTESNVEESVAESVEEPMLNEHRNANKFERLIKEVIAEDTDVDEQLYELPTEENIENQLVVTDNLQASIVGQEETVMGQLVEHEGKNYVLVDEQWYELNF